jgi:hypothetical protein
MQPLLDHQPRPCLEPIDATFHGNGSHGECILDGMQIERNLNGTLHRRLLLCLLDGSSIADK